MKNYNPDIIYVRIFGGTLIPLSRVSLVTTNPNNGKVVQEIPLEFCVNKLVHNNMNNFEDVKDNWKELDNYNIVESKR